MLIVTVGHACIRKQINYESSEGVELFYTIIAITAIIASRRVFIAAI